MSVVKSFAYEGEEVSYEGKILPHQPFNSYLYNNQEDYMVALYGLLSSQAEHIKRDSFTLNEHERVGFEEMSSPPVQLALIQFLIDLTQSKRFLEIGTFIGNTAMHVSRMMGEGSEVTTIEKFDEFATLAQKNFDDNGFSKDSIKLLQGDACMLMQTLPDNHFDLIYVDGDKGRYLELSKTAEKKLSDKGIILVDDVFFHGDVLNTQPKTEKGRGCKAVLDHYKSTKDFGKYVLPINNGILLLKRL